MLQGKFEFLYYRVVKVTSSSTYRSCGMGRMRKAKNAAAKFCAELHLLGYPGAQIRQVNFRRTGHGLLSSAHCDYEVYSYAPNDAPNDIVSEAEDNHTFLNSTNSHLRVKSWALHEWYAQNWVKASRLFAIVGMFEYSIAAQRNFDHIDGRAFKHEVVNDKYKLTELAKSYFDFYGISGIFEEVHRPELYVIE